VSDSFFGLDVSTSVTLFNSRQNLMQPAVRANTEGEYVFAGLKADRYRVRASCEKSRGDSLASVSSVPVVANITLPNHAPKLVGIAAFDGAKGITRAGASATIKVVAAVRDAENDPIDYLWKAADGSGSVAAVNAAQQQRTTGASAALQTLYLMVRDGKGGYTYKRFDLPVGGAGVAFSGRVIDETTLNPVDKAEVTVNGASTTTNAQGWFSVTTAPVASPERYVLNITHPQYVLLSRIHDKASAGDVYPLIRVQSTSVNPSGVIDVTDDGSSGPCGGKPAVRLPSHGKRTAATTGTTETPPCRRVGARLVLPPGCWLMLRGTRHKVL
jgi:hypothetical protein